MKPCKARSCIRLGDRLLRVGECLIELDPSEAPLPMGVCSAEVSRWAGGRGGLVVEVFAPSSRDGSLRPVYMGPCTWRPAPDAKPLARGDLSEVIDGPTPADRAWRLIVSPMIDALHNQGRDMVKTMSATADPAAVVELIERALRGKSRHEVALVEALTRALLEEPVSEDMPHETH